MDIQVKDKNLLYQIKDLVEGQTDEMKAALEKIDAQEARSAAFETDFSAAREAIKGQQDLLANVNARLDKLDEILPKGGKGYLPANGEDPKAVGRRKLGEFLVDLSRNAIGADEKYGWISYLRTASQIEKTDAKGGFLVPEEQSREIIKLVSDFGFARRFCRIMPMTREVMRVPLADYTPTTLVGSGALPTTSDPKSKEGEDGFSASQTFTRPELIAARLLSYDRISIEVAEDSDPSLMNFLVDVFAEAVALAEDHQVLSASAAPFTGVLFEAGVGVHTLGNGSLSFKQIGYRDLVDAYAAADEKVQDSGIWVMSAYTWNQIKKAMVDANGFPFIDPTNPLGAPPKTILGRPVVLSTKMPKAAEDTGATTRAFIAYGDFSRYAIFGDRMRMAVDISPDAGFISGELIMRVMERFAVKLVHTNAFSKIRTAAS